MSKIIDSIVRSGNRTSVDFIGKNLYDALCFGFSYIESEDHFVNYIVANSRNIKKIFAEISDSSVKISEDSVGELWMAKLLISEKLRDKHIMFSNNTLSIIINLNLNPYKEFDIA